MRSLRAVPATEPTDRDVWLALYRRKQAAIAEQRACELAMRPLKAAVMAGLNQWGLDDDMLARELGR